MVVWEGNPAGTTAGGRVVACGDCNGLERTWVDWLLPDALIWFVFLESVLPCEEPSSSSSNVRSMTPLASPPAAFVLCMLLSAVLLFAEESAVCVLLFWISVLDVAGGSVGDGLLNAEIGIFICIGPRLGGGLNGPDVLTVGKEVLAACVTECAVETACTVSVVLNDDELAGELRCIPGLDTAGLFGFTVLADAKDTGVLVRFPTAG